MKSMKYDVVRTIVWAYKFLKLFIFLDQFLADKIAPKFSSEMMYVS